MKETSGNVLATGDHRLVDSSFNLCPSSIPQNANMTREQAVEDCSCYLFRLENFLFISAVLGRVKGCRWYGVLAELEGSLHVRIESCDQHGATCPWIVGIKMDNNLSS